MQNIRNFCIISHIDHGKSTLADRFLELTGTVEKRKMREQYLDMMDLEREKGITIKLQPVRMIWQLPNHSQIRNPKSEIRNKSQITNSNVSNSCLEFGKLEFRNCLGFRNSNLEFANSEFILNLIDTPGHVDFSYEVSRSLAAVEGAILLVDAAKGLQAQTLANLDLAQKQDLVIIPVINKIDLPNAQIEKTEVEIKSLFKDAAKILKISAKYGQGVEEVLGVVIEKIPPPAGKKELPLRALIFDSHYDPYKGVIAYVRVVDGKISKGDEILMMASGAKAEALEIGYFKPELLPQDGLRAGDIGYIATGIKDIGRCRVGDTIIKSKIKNKKSKIIEVEPLAGYKEPEPMVYASFYLDKSGDFNLLRSSLEKLKLNDASLTFEPESSEALGRGFRLGFLGMLHLEIISERLKREFSLEPIITTPSVLYEVTKVDGSKISIFSASDLPDQSQIKEILEPWANLEIITPLRYLNPVLKLLKTLRGKYKDTKYLSQDRLIVKFEVPLADIIQDLYDRLKSVSSGYASMSYKIISSKPADLARLDILVAGEKVDAFSKIVPRERAYQEGKSIVSKLKEAIPRQNFAVALQAALGGKIIARENIKVLRKDVIAKLYGGDYTRKRKLLEKQKKGKRKMKTLGKVNIPSEVFLEVLKKQ